MAQGNVPFTRVTDCMTPDLPAGHQDSDRKQPPNVAETAPQWYCRVFDTEFGPLPLATLCEMIKSGQLGRNDQVRANDNCFWQAARQVTALQPWLADADASDPPSVNQMETSRLSQEYERQAP